MTNRTRCWDGQGPERSLPERRARPSTRRPCLPAPATTPAKPKPPGNRGGGQQRMVRRDLLKFRWSLDCPGCGFKVTGEGQPKPGQRLARCGCCKVVLVLGGG